MYDFDSVTFSILPTIFNIDLSGIPDQEIEAEESFFKVDLVNYLTYLNPDSIEYFVQTKELITAVENGEFSAYFPTSKWYGPDTIIITAQHINNPTIFDTDTVIYKVIDRTSIDEDMENSYLIYPIPSNGEINVVLDRERVDIQIYNLLGELIESEKGVQMAFKTHLGKGIYLLKVFSKKGDYHRKIVIK